MITPYVPYPLHSGGQIRTWNLVNKLKNNHNFTLVCYYREEKEKQYKIELEKIFKNIYFIKKKNPWTINSLIKSTGKYPLLLNLYDSKDAKELLLFLLEKEKWDIIHCEPFYIMQNLPSVVLPPVLLAEHNIEYLVYERYSNNRKIFILNKLMSLDVKKIKKWEEIYWKFSKKIITVSNFDKNIIEKTGIKNISVIPNAVDINYFQYTPNFKKDSKTILFVGNFKWFPNIEAVTLLKEKIFPKMFEKNKNIKLLIVGKSIPDKIKKWQNNNIQIIENMLDIRKAYYDSNVLLAPIYSGSGTKYKILEAMASGCPVVTTPIGAEGIDAIDGENIIIGKTDNDLINKTLQIITNSNKSNIIRKNARLLIEKQYNWDIVSTKLDSIYQEMKKIK